MRALTTALLALALVACTPGDDPRPRPPQWAQPMIDSSLENFHRVDDHLYRSAQPDGEDMAEIAALGIRNILTLREYHDDEDEAEDTDLRLISLPMEADEVTADQIEEALRIIVEAKGPILVHCWHGSDRTGAVVAAYRMVVQGWTAEDAWDEMLSGGYGFHGIYEEPMRELIFSLDVEGIRQRMGLSTETRLMDDQD